ncbi:hypothetical protein E2F47_27485 [Mycobacterium eburneum]|nr:hypothetical protein E2F47_27485 [Mycobacterium eburneum]
MHRTIHVRTARRLLASFAAGAVLAGTAIGYCGHAHADYSPFVPNPPLWCPGNAPGINVLGYGGYCEGKSFPDGTRLNTFRVGWFWNPLRCIIPDGTINPPLAGPGGCGGFLG